MDIIEARELADTLMTEHGLTAAGWNFGFDNAVSRLGVCMIAKKSITISRHMTGAAEAEQVRQTILHEIAHALLGTRTVMFSPRRNGHTLAARPVEKDFGHGPEWKALAASIGYTGKRTASNPYRHGVTAPVQEPIIARFGLSTPVPVQTGYVGQVGDDVRLPSGREGVIISVGRSRFTVLCDSGERRSVSFAGVTQIPKKDRVVNPLPVRTRVPVSIRKRVGDVITFNLHAGRNYAGRTATVVSVGTARYKVRVTDSGTVLFAPFSLVA
jgi:hypothetical protein